MATILNGKLFMYDDKNVAFKYGESKKIVVAIGGLTNGLLSVYYFKNLIPYLDSKGWSTVNPILSSSYMGFGTNSLQTDANEIDSLVEFLYKNFDAERVVLLGHSTGCQDSVYYMAHGKESKRIHGVVLQAPVSDREYLKMSEPDYEKLVKWSKEQIDAGNPDKLLDQRVFGAAITAYRFYSLAAKYGDDDLFSTDFNEEELKKTLGHLTVPTLFVFGTSDQFVPPEIDKAANAERMKKTVKDSEVLIIEGALHELREDQHQSKFFGTLSSFLERRM
eukprot:TRINITY_DN3959_c0_g1_i1.p1 TRINITY_DN3959_c0_g1~~TRINITY_DN3959_c0_g1_i1.p1  ORF type:complete len:277 (-),score=92.55 TRINITY_DN3959_c0_g1_i1:62-892(-)